MGNLKNCYITILLLTSISAYCQDIVVTNVSYNTNQIQYQQFIGDITLKNTGSNAINQFNVTNIYFSKDPILDSDDIYAGFVNFTNLNPGESISKPISGGFNQFGINADSDYQYVIVNADYRKEVNEENEDNNIWTGSVSIKNVDVDLSVDSYNISPSDTISQGDLLAASITLRNHSNYNIHNIYVTYYLSIDEVLDDADITIGYPNWLGFYWNSTASQHAELAIPHIVPSNYFLIAEIDTVGQELNINDINKLNNIEVLSKIYIKEDKIDSTLNFDQEFGTRSWVEDGHLWSWDNSGWDNIRNHKPHTGSGHGASVAGYHSKLSSDGIINIQGIWLFTDLAHNFTHLNLKGYDGSGTLIYDVALNPMHYANNYKYITLNWVGVKSFMVDFDSTDPILSPIILYDDMDYVYLSEIVGKDIRTECDSYTWIDRNTYTESNNTATFNIPGGAANGGDSLVFLDLTILHPATGTDTRTACNAHTWIDGNTYTESNNTATFNIPGGAANGCDSLVYLDLTILHSAIGTDTRTACNSYTWIDGNTYTESNNTATFNIAGGAANGCDSLVYLDLIINKVSDITTSVDGLTITANNHLASYVWSDCNNNNNPIPDETNQSFTASANGSYAVQLTENGCVATSECIPVLILALNESPVSDKIEVYPNPSNGIFTVEFENIKSLLSVKIFSIKEGVLDVKSFQNTNIIKLELNQPKGIYFIEVIDDQGSKSVSRVVIE